MQNSEQTNQYCHDYSIKNGFYAAAWKSDDALSW